MILLLAGTAETASLAEALSALAPVLVSTATDQPLSLPDSPRIRRRAGPLDAGGLMELMERENVRLLVDATHPYAAEAHRTARAAAEKRDCPLLRFARPGTDRLNAAASITDGGDIVFAADHAAAARVAFSFGHPVLLTVGSRNVAVYVEESMRTGADCIARVLPDPASLDACRNAGLSPDRVIAARGPFSLEQNLEVIDRYGIGVLVTKDGGAAGGVPEKLAAAKKRDCRVVVVHRPQEEGEAFDDIHALAEAARNVLSVE